MKTRVDELGGTSSVEKTVRDELEREKCTSVLDGPACSEWEMTKSSGRDERFCTTKERLR